MNYWLLLIPLLTALTGWLIVRLLTKMMIDSIVRQYSGWAQKIGKMAAAEFSSFPLESTLSDPQNFEALRPLVEEHVDEFLRKKLPEQMPMIGMFIGDKTISTLKGIFIQEVETLFPQVMNQFATNMLNKISIEKSVTDRILAVTPDRLQIQLRAITKKEINKASFLALAIGLLIGIIQLGIIAALN